MVEKPFAESAVQNEAPIRAVLAEHLAGRRAVLEIASGTGQHAVAFARAFPQLSWQPTERPGNLGGIELWREEAGLPNLRPPRALDLSAPGEAGLESASFDAIFSANTVHIVAWPLVENLFTLAGNLLPAGGILALYGPFNYGGRFTSSGNADFNLWLRARDPVSGVRDFEALDALARAEGLRLRSDHAMPANNRTLVWERPWT